jgi:cytochrome b6-f complex iron-sulfur subunit
MSEAKAVVGRATRQPHAETSIAVETQRMTRREVLNIAWLASLGIFLAELGGVGYLFAMPRFKAGEFGGVFTIPKDQLPPTDAPPKAVNEGKFWLSSTDQGVLAIYKVCTHLGCLYDWAPSETRFICPCHGSQYQKDGTYIQGPAPRSLDRFVLKAVDSAGTVVASKDLAQMTGEPSDALELPANAVAIEIDTGKRKFGKPHG